MVSIIVPIYNIKEYIPRCVESLLRQQGDFEILLVDDGSTDGSGVLCDTLSQTHDRLRVLHKENGGLSDARNAGLDAAQGDWILFVDGDDYLADHSLERLLDLAEPDVDFIQFHYHETEDCTWQGDPQMPACPEIELSQSGMWHRVYELGGEGASSCTKLWNRRLLDNLRFHKGILHEDEEFLNRALPQCSKAIYTQLVLYGYFMRPGSIVRSGFNPRSMDIFPILEARIPILEELGCQQLVHSTYVWQFQTAAWQYCLAKKAGLKTEAKLLKEKLLRLAKQQDLELSGQYRLLYKIAKYTRVAPGIYYWVRRITRKT